MKLNHIALVAVSMGFGLVSSLTISSLMQRQPDGAVEQLSEADEPDNTFQTPVGVIPFQDGDFVQHSLQNGYISYPARDRSDTYRTCFRVSLSAERIEPFLERLVRVMMPGKAYGILVPSHDIPSADIDKNVDTWLTDFRDRFDLTQDMKPYNFRLINDGFVAFGYGWYDQENPAQIEEVFVNSKKEIIIKTSHEDAVAGVLVNERIEEMHNPHFISDYETMVLELGSAAEVFPKKYAHFANDEFLSGVYIPELIEELEFKPN